MTKLKSNKKLPMGDVLRYHWQHAKKHPKLMAASFIAVPLTVVVERYGTPILIAILLSSIQKGDVSLESSTWLIVTYGVAQIISQLVGYNINLYAMWTLQIRGGRLIHQEVFDKLSEHSLKFYSDSFAGSLVSKANRLYSAFLSFWDMIIFSLLFIATSIVATIVGTSLMVWQYALVLLVLIIIYIYVVYRHTRFLRPLQKARSKAYTKQSAQLSDAISNIFTVKTDGQEKLERQRLDKELHNIVKRESTVRNGLMRFRSVQSFILVIARVFALIASVWAVQYNLADAGVVYLCLTYTFNLLQEMWNISGVMRSMYQVVGDSEEMLEIMRKPSSVVDKTDADLQVTTGVIDINNMTFTHDEGKGETLFRNFSLSVESGEKVGLVGASGSGKTTLTKLLLRFADIDSGEVLIDKQNIAEVTQNSLRSSIAYVPQEPLLFHRSIRENIAYAKPHASDDEVVSAAKKAGAFEFVSQLKDGFDTLVGERGIKLSGGQRQRIAIARAILKDAPILVLDEATSALDSESEKLIQKSLETLMKSRTSIIIAHRLSTIAKLDRIVVLDHGMIVEDGTHSELLASGGTYAKLWKHQSGGFIDE